MDAEKKSTAEPNIEQFMESLDQCIRVINQAIWMAKLADRRVGAAMKPKPEIMYEEGKAQYVQAQEAVKQKKWTVALEHANKGIKDFKSLLDLAQVDGGQSNPKNSTVYLERLTQLREKCLTELLRKEPKTDTQHSSTQSATKGK